MIINRFVTVLADTDAARDIHYHVRFRVFCEETGFEAMERFPDAKERDAYDECASHFLVWDRSDRQWVGAMRLVRTEKTQLPLENICGKAPQDLDLVRSRAVEFSRFCILSDYRRTPTSMSFGLHIPEGNSDSCPIPVFFRQEECEIFLRLVRASLGWGQAHGVDYCYCIITPALARVVLRMGIPLSVVGEPVEHRGRRIPYRYNIAEAERGLSTKTPAFDRIVQTDPAYVKYSDFVAGRAEPSCTEALVVPVADYTGQDRSNVVVALPNASEAWSHAYTEDKRTTSTVTSLRANLPASLPLNPRGGANEVRFRMHA